MADETARDSSLEMPAEVAREVPVIRALLKGCSGVKRRSIRSRRVVLNEKARGGIRDYNASLDHVPTPDEFLFLLREGGIRKGNSLSVAEHTNSGILTPMQDLETIFVRVSSPEGQRLALAEIARASRGGPVFGSDPNDPSVIIETALDGTERRGRFVDRKFVAGAK
jgi:hypothetical protein